MPAGPMRIPPHLRPCMLAGKDGVLTGQALSEAHLKGVMPF